MNSNYGLVGARWMASTNNKYDGYIQSLRYVRVSLPRYKSTGLPTSKTKRDIYASVLERKG